MTCTCTYYEPGLITYKDVECPEHGEAASRRNAEAKALLRKKLLEAGITKSDLRLLIG
jgi:hypothetical protein